MTFLTLLCLVLLVLPETHCDNTTLTDPLSAQLQFLLNEEKDLRRNLETRVQRLRNEVQAINNVLVPCTCPPMPQLHKNSTQVSFTTTLSLAKTSLTTSTDLLFDSDVSNIGNSYNATVSQFTAPVSGLYGFSLTVFMNPGSWVGMHLVKNGHSVLKVRTGHYLYRSTNRMRNMGTNFVLLNVTAGESVWPQYLGDSDSRRIYADGVTTFSGFLLHEF